MSALVVESLEQRLHRLVPGAELVDSMERFKRLEHQDGCWSFEEDHVLTDCSCTTRQFLPTEADLFSVVRDGRVLAVGPSEREAVSRAVFLYGSRR